MYFEHLYLQCESCRARFSFPDKLFEYTDEDTPESLMAGSTDSTSMLLRPIWCHACNAPRYREHIPSLDDFALSLSILRDPEGRMPVDLDRLDFDQELIHIGNSEGIEAVQHLASRMINRTQGRRCLLCGSTSLTTIDNDSHVTALLHEDCGGALKRTGVFGSCVPRSPIVRVIRFFDWSGKFRWAIKFVHASQGTEWVREPVEPWS